MSRNTSLFFACAILGSAAPSAFAQENAGVVEELRAVRQMVEQQSKQLDALTKHVAKLAASVEGKSAPKVEGTTPAEPAPRVATPPAPTPPAPAEPAAPPKAELAGPPKHVVAKGETLTSIAKHYNIPLADLLKANKDINDRKLQIGQTITIPTAPSSKAPESANEKAQ